MQRPKKEARSLGDGPAWAKRAAGLTVGPDASEGAPGPDRVRPDRVRPDGAGRSLSGTAAGTATPSGTVRAGSRGHSRGRSVRPGLGSSSAAGREVAGPRPLLTRTRPGSSVCVCACVRECEWVHARVGAHP